MWVKKSWTEWRGRDSSLSFRLAFQWWTDGRTSSETAAEMGGRKRNCSSRTIKRDWEREKRRTEREKKWGRERENEWTVAFIFLGMKWNSLGGGGDARFPFWERRSAVTASLSQSCDYTQQSRSEYEQNWKIFLSGTHLKYVLWSCRITFAK